ncbi:Zinc-binding dehydrogenase OS=Streptomyces tendae OX=1932 GN=GUR47_07275 PE=3 SV=1 [Streptomyces tendae]
MQESVDRTGVARPGYFAFVSPGRAKPEALGRLVDQGGLRPVIGAVLPLAVIAEEQTLLEGGPPR